MEIKIDTRYLAQEEYTALTQILVNVGVRQKLEEMRSTQVKNKTAKKPVGNNKKNGKRKKSRFLTQKQLTIIHNGVREGKTIYQMAVETGLAKKKIGSVIYRMKYNPSDLMLKIMGKR